MTAKEAAEIIGCSARQVRVLCAHGILEAAQRKIPGGFYWEVDRRSVNAYAEQPQKQGWKRGKKRD
jgi:hypothetical protein